MCYLGSAICARISLVQANFYIKGLISTVLYNVGKNGIGLEQGEIYTSSALYVYSMLYDFPFSYILYTICIVYLSFQLYTVHCILYILFQCIVYTHMYMTYDLSTNLTTRLWNTIYNRTLCMLEVCT